MIITVKDRALYFHNKYGEKAISVINDIITFSPNKPSNELDTKLYFSLVKEEIRKLRNNEKFSTS